MARLAAFVHVAGPDGAPCVFGPDDAVPEWAILQITNPAAWAVPPVVEVPDVQAPVVEAPVVAVPARKPRAKRPTTK